MPRREPKPALAKPSLNAELTRALVYEYRDRLRVAVDPAAEWVRLTDAMKPVVRETLRLAIERLLPGVTLG